MMGRRKPPGARRGAPTPRRTSRSMDALTAALIGSPLVIVSAEHALTVANEVHEYIDTLDYAPSRYRLFMVADNRLDEVGRTSIVIEGADEIVEETREHIRAHENADAWGVRGAP